MGAAVAYEVQLVRQICITCGIVFAVPSEWDYQRRQDHANIHCPNGHPQIYTIKSEAEKLREELERERQKVVLAQNSARMEREQREKAERKLKRVDKGVCPKCNRHFTDVERHMQSKHKVAD